MKKRKFFFQILTLTLTIVLSAVWVNSSATLPAPKKYYIAPDGCGSQHGACPRCGTYPTMNPSTTLACDGSIEQPWGIVYGLNFMGVEFVQPGLLTMIKVK